MKLEMWANAQRDGCPAKYMAPSVQRRKVWLMPTNKVRCSKVAKSLYPLKYDGVTQTRQSISAVSGLKFTILWLHVEDILLLNKFFYDCRYVP